jgi:hypothetical protein
VTTLAGTPPACCAAAIVNRQLTRHGREPFSTPAELANTLFHSSTRVAVALEVVTALVLIGALIATVAGIWKVAHGDRGGASLTLSGVYGLVGLMAAMGVVL